MKTRTWQEIRALIAQWLFKLAFVAHPETVFDNAAKLDALQTPDKWPSTHAQHGVLLEQIKELHAENERLREAAQAVVDAWQSGALPSRMHEPIERLSQEAEKDD